MLSLAQCSIELMKIYNYIKAINIKRSICPTTLIKVASPKYGLTLNHTLGGGYYSKTETDSLLSSKSDTSHTHDSRYYTESEIDTKLSGKSDTSHNHAFLQGDDSITVKPQSGNEINFGGTNSDSTIYFGYRAVDSKPIPATYIFGNSGNGTATLKAANFQGNVNSSGTSYKVYGAVFN